MTEDKFRYRRSGKIVSLASRMMMMSFVGQDPFPNLVSSLALHFSSLPLEVVLLLVDELLLRSYLQDKRTRSESASILLSLVFRRKEQMFLSSC